MVACLAALGLLLLGPAASAQEPRDGLHVDAVVEYYDVPGGTFSEVVAAMNQMRVQGPGAPLSQGLTRYHIRPEWVARASGGSCRPGAVKVFVDIVVTLPRWDGVEDRPDDERARWGEIERAIRVHEYRHRDLTIDAADRLLSSIQSLETRGCTALRQVVASTLSVADGRLREAHAELDRTTPNRLRPGPPGG
jgi:predicted secreted Zn-dependent protease